MAHRIAVLGAGLMGERMIGALAEDGRFQVIAAYDPDPAHLAHVEERFGVSSTASEDALLALPDLDGLYIASPPKHHVPSALRAIDQGLAVYLEKPLAASTIEAARLVAALEGLPARVAMHFPFATLPGVAEIEAALSSGTVGALERIEVILHFSQWPRSWHKAGEWLRGGEEGGFLREVFSHFAFLITRLVGPLTVETVVRRDEARAGGCERAITATFTAGEQEVPVTLVGGAGGAAPDFNRLTIYGEKRSVRLEDWSKLTVSDGNSWQDLVLADPAPRKSWALHHDALDAFLRGEPHPLATVREGAQVVEVVEALRGAPATP